MENLYGEICFYENLLLAFLKASKGKRKKWYVKEFRKNLRSNLLELQKELVTMTYEPRPMKTFVIRDPKTRFISASNFSDRIVHHALCNIIEPIFDRSFIYDSCANRKGKGTHLALKRFDIFKRKVSGNGKTFRWSKDKNRIYGYVLKADIRHYFDCVYHEILIGIVRNRVKDEKVLWLVNKILDNHEGRGMPIGNLTSQFFANVYLNELDKFVKHGLRAKYYIRYVDDFVLLDASKERLESYLDVIGEFLKTIKIELHPEKTKIIALSKGTKITGFRVFYKYKIPLRRNISKINSDVIYYKNLYKNGRISKKELYQRLNGWLAYAAHANTYKLRKRIEAKLLL